jgi:pimeloyl-ACP methyl ester carboxylesterase
VASDLKTIPAVWPLQLRYRAGQGKTLVVCFSGIGSRPSEVPPPEFVQSATQGGRYHGLFVSDQTRSWLNHEGLEGSITDAILRVMQDLGCEDLHLLGNSMGGSMALLLADKLPARSVLALSPQYSVDPEVMPDEPRWMRFRKRIKNFHHPEIRPQPREGQRIYIAHGGHEAELRHAHRFPRADGIQHFIVPEADHNMARDLKEAGVLFKLIGATIEGRPLVLRKTLAKQGGMFIRQFEQHHAAQGARIG